MPQKRTAIFHSSSSAETKRFAENFAKRITNEKSKFAHHRRALVLALVGELGSGKTTFVQGFLRGFGIRRRATSPTFVLLRRFAIRHLRFASVYHIDAYRIRKPQELIALGLRGVLADPKNLVLIEWADRIKNILPKKRIRIRLSHAQTAHARVIKVA